MIRLFVITFVRHTIIATAVFILIMAGIPCPAEAVFNKHTDKDFEFSLFIPSQWQRKEDDLYYKKIITLQSTDGAEIRITAMRYSEKEKSKWNSWKEWYLNNIGNSMMEIIETDTVKIKKEIEGKLIVFEYMSKQGKMMQRVLIARIKENIIVIECKAEFQQFYKFAPTFDRTMSSLEPH